MEESEMHDGRTMLRREIGARDSAQRRTLSSLSTSVEVALVFFSVSLHCKYPK